MDRARLSPRERRVLAGIEEALGEDAPLETAPHLPALT